MEDALSTSNQVSAYAALHRTVTIVQSDVWRNYKDIEVVQNQGSDFLGSSFRCRSEHRRREGAKMPAIVKQEPFDLPRQMRFIKRPVHDNIVELRDAFWSGSILSLVYEDMDISLQDTLNVDMDIWIGEPCERHLQAASILQQIVMALQYLHEHEKIAHGDIQPANILLNLQGRVKIANVGHSILQQSTNFTIDYRGLAKTFYDILPPGSHSMSLFRGIHHLCFSGALKEILKVAVSYAAIRTFLIAMWNSTKSSTEYKI